jgi:fumarylacetoacetate (FAA) hydrolase family protein
VNQVTHLPIDITAALLIGRVWRPSVNGPSVVAVRNGQVFDLTASVPTVSDLLDREDCAEFALTAPGELLGSADQLIQNSLNRSGSNDAPTLCAPCDLQTIKASGVTFIVSLLERLIEEKAGGSASKAMEIRDSLQSIIGTDLSTVRPGSEAANKLKQELIQRGEWSQYLEVGIGVDAEVFSKTTTMASVGFGQQVGLHPASKWNNPEPEVVLAVNSHGSIVGATLGNDVNLRDIEGRSALLLTRAKDNNGSCSIGPFIRLFDERFTLDTVRKAEVSLLIEGQDNFTLQDISRMSEISRDPADLVAQVYGDHHQYPDGFMLFLGTMFSPIKDRNEPGGGFTHHLGDRVTISTPSLGALVNEVQLSTEIPRWSFGIRSLYHNLAGRGLLGRY